MFWFWDWNGFFDTQKCSILFKLELDLHVWLGFSIAIKLHVTKFLDPTCFLGDEKMALWNSFLPKDVIFISKFST